MEPAIKIPRCPRCDGKGEAVPGGLYRCSRCKGCYDDDPEEGGDYSDRNAVEGGDYSDRNAGVRIEREERRQERRRR